MESRPGRLAKEPVAGLFTGSTRSARVPSVWSSVTIITMLHFGWGTAPQSTTLSAAAAGRVLPGWVRNEAGRIAATAATSATSDRKPRFRPPLSTNSSPSIASNQGTPSPGAVSSARPGMIAHRVERCSRGG